MRIADQHGAGTIAGPIRIRHARNNAGDFLADRTGKDPQRVTDTKSRHPNRCRTSIKSARSRQDNYQGNIDRDERMEATC